MPTPANIRETLICFGKVKQTDLQTINQAADCIRLGKLNAALAEAALLTEDDAQEIGKGHEWPIANYKTAWNAAGSMEKYLSSQFAAWAFAFGLGNAAMTQPEAGAYRHTCTPQDPAGTAGIELPAFTFVEQIRPGANVILNRALVGNVIQDLSIAIGTGPGRANARLTVNFAGCGKLTEPSGITMPSATTEHLLNAASATCTINGVDYVTAKNLVSLEFAFANNLRLDQGYYPGSGFQDAGDPASGQLRGRIEFGDRAATLRFVARFVNGSAELTKLKAQTEGTAAFTLTGATIVGATKHDISVTFHRVVFATAVVGEADGIVTVSVECRALWHASNGLLTAYATTNIDKFGAEP